MVVSWHGKHVLVTGAGGFIGSHLTERLVREGARVRALVRYTSTGSVGWLDQLPEDAVEFVKGDVIDRDCVSGAMQDVDVVFHLAALIGIPYSYSLPHAYARVNIEGTLNVLQAAREQNVSRVVHTSTSEVYGTAQMVPITERHPLAAQSPYAATKIGADKLVESFHASFGLPVVTVRPFNTYGPRQSQRAIVPTIMAQCLTGHIVRLGNIHPTRDLNYVDNTVEGFLAAGIEEAAIGKTINIGSGREIRIADLVILIADTVGRPVHIESSSDRVRSAASEVERLVADNRLAHELLQWEPRVSLEEGLARTLVWMREHLNAYRPSHYVA